MRLGDLDEVFVVSVGWVVPRDEALDEAADGVGCLPPLLGLALGEEAAHPLLDDDGGLAHAQVASALHQPFPVALDDGRNVILLLLEGVLCLEESFGEADEQLSAGRKRYNFCK